MENFDYLYWNEMISVAWIVNVCYYFNKIVKNCHFLPKSMSAFLMQPFLQGKLLEISSYVVSDRQQYVCYSYHVMSIWQLGTTDLLDMQYPMKWCPVHNAEISTFSGL